MPTGEEIPEGYVPRSRFAAELGNQSLEELHREILHLIPTELNRWIISNFEVPPKVSLLELKRFHELTFLSWKQNQARHYRFVLRLYKIEVLLRERFKQVLP